MWPDRTMAVFGLLSLGLLVYCTFLRPVEQVMADAATSIFCLVYIGYTLIALPALHAAANGPSLVTFLLCAVWVGDTAALYVGRAWGRHKLAPKLSPNKTWEGAVGSMAGSLMWLGGFGAWRSCCSSGTTHCSPILTRPGIGWCWRWW